MGSRNAVVEVEDETTIYTKTTKYNTEALYQLEVRGILPQQTPFERPSNYDQIRKAIEQPWPSPAPLDKREYIMYWKSVFESTNEKAIAKTPCELLFGMQIPFSDAHGIKDDEHWQNHVPIQGDAEPVNLLKFNKAPKPDCAEGLKKQRVPKWIFNDLNGLIAPSSLAFPNFILELKRDGSMYTAYAQNMHNGSTAVQAYHEYYAQILNTPDESWNIARVGSIQFNGSIVEGNIHWVSKIDGDGTRPQDREYHMTRVMHNSTTGLGLEDFEKARREARNFRDYFRNVREELLDDFKKHAQRPANRPAPTVFRNISQSAHAESIMLSEPLTQSSCPTEVPRKQRGRPRKTATVEHSGVAKTKTGKSSLSNKLKQVKIRPS